MKDFQKLQYSADVKQGDSEQWAFIEVNCYSTFSATYKFTPKTQQSSLVLLS